MRTIIIDDEKQIREGLKILLSQIKQVTIVGEATTLTEGREIIERLQPDLVLLDIQLKNQTGFNMLESLSRIDFKLIFITAYNEYALKAFKYNAFDYLLKPVDPEELYLTIERLEKISKEMNEKRKEEEAEYDDEDDFGFENDKIKIFNESPKLELDKLDVHDVTKGLTIDDTPLLNDVVQLV